MPNLYHTINSDFFLQSFFPFGCWYISMTKPICQLHFLTGSQPFTKHPFHTPFHPKNIFVSDSCFISIQICSQWKQGHVQLHITRLRLRKNKDICQSICGQNMFLGIQMASQGDLPAEPSGMTMTCWETDSQCYQHQIQDATRTWTRSCSGWK